jgi:hypothetical protein
MTAMPLAAGTGAVGTALVLVAARRRRRQVQAPAVWQLAR